MAIDKKLKAVNRMLRSIDMMQLNAWEEMDAISFSARDELDDVTETIQAEGWYFNEEDIILVPDIEGKIQLPESILSLQHLTDKNIIIRNGSLYDKSKAIEGLDGAIFEGNQEVRVIYLFDYELIPPEARDYITNQATYNFQSNVIGGKGADQSLYLKMQQSRTTLLQVDAVNRDTSILGLGDNTDFISS